ncbi:MAG: (Fe-S)-binding protein [Desulforhopalus sp.]|nr:(Fe-S)-binding protein [Desulforhopalus sp.]
MTICIKHQQNLGIENAGRRSTNAAAMHLVADECARCGSCVQECGFLQCHGTPGQIAEEHLSGSKEHFDTAFSCSLCHLCTQICPKRLPIAEMFLTIRRKAVLNGQGRYKEHRRILGYEKFGNSAPFTGYLLPVSCTTVFFPGCSLPGIRPEQTYQLFLLLQENIANLGIVFDCCNKPSHDLGFHKRFEKRFQPKLERLRSQGITKIITGCPSCFQIFQQYGKGLEVTTAYTHLVGHIQQSDTACDTKFTIHDACTVRFEPEIQQAVRELVRARGIKISEMPHNREATLCCGEGGAASSDWKEKRLAEANGLPLLTFCAGCTMSLNSGTTSHLVDLLFEPPDTMLSPTKPICSLFTYVNRLLLKRKIAKHLQKELL